MKKLIYIIFFLVLPVMFWGQQTMSFRFVENELLRSADILKVHVDKTGLAWILTNKGFMSYDGSVVKYFKDTSGGSFTHPMVNFPPHICEDWNGNLYAWKYGIGMICFNPKNGTYTVCSVKGSDSTLFRNSTAYDLYIDSDNIFWIASRSGLIRYSRQTGEAKFIGLSEKNLEFIYKEVNDSIVARNVISTAKKMVTGVAPDFRKSGKLWISNSGAIWQFDKLSGEITEAVIPDPANPQKYGYVITDLLDISEDTLVFTTLGGGIGIYLKNEKTFRFYLWDSLIYLKQGIRTNRNTATSVFKRKGPGIYVAYNDAFPAFFNTGSGKQYFLTGDSSIKGYKIYVDNLDRMWVFTRSRIGYAASPQLSFGTIDVSFQQQPNNARNILSSIYWDEKENKYYAGVNFSDGVFVWNKDFSRSTIYPAINPPNLKAIEPAILDITNVSGGSFAIDLSNHLVVLDKNKNNYYHYKLVPGYNKLNIPVKEAEREALDLLKRSEKDFYLLAAKGDVYRINSSDQSAEKIASFRDSSTQSLWGLGKLMKGVNKDELFVTDYKTIYKLNLLTNKVVSFLPVFKSPPVPVNFVDIAADQNGNLWIATRDNEVLCYSGKDFKLIDRVPGKLRFSSFSNIVVTPENVLLAGETNALTVYDINHKKLFRYNDRSGLATKGFSRVLYENGFVFLSYEDKVQYIPLKDLLREQQQPVAYLTGLYVYGDEISNDSLLLGQHTVELNYRQNFLTFRFSALNFDLPDQIKYEYRLLGLDTSWINTDYFNGGVSYANLKPGTYSFQIKANLPNSGNESVNTYTIIIVPAWWQTRLFKGLVVLLAMILIAAFVYWRIRFVRQQEQKKSKYQKEMLELEAKALRAQMNPHFIFNCLNSIKSLIQEHEEEKAVTYLTTFSKLIRTLFNNADKKEISLYDEIETCKLYLQLESMRFDTKFSYTVNIDEAIDLKSVQVPALIIQPFIENAIWHGIVPHDKGGNVSLNVIQENSIIEIIIDDDGVGRETSQQNKSASGLVHQSKGVNLTQSRLELNNLLQQRKAKLEIIDKKDENGTAQGTTVIIKIKEEQS